MARARARDRVQPVVDAIVLNLSVIATWCSGINNAFNYSTTFLENNGLASNTTMVP